MPSNSLLKNKYFDKLSLNKLKVNSLKVNKLLEKKHDCSCKSISYLFSLDLQKATWNSETNELTFSKGDALSLLRFTDRPYQFDKLFKDSDAIEYLDILFRSNPNGINSFEKNQPNGVLVAPEGQQAYNIKLQSVDNDGNVKLILDLFKDIDGNYVSQLKSFTDQKVSLFIDNGRKQTKCPTRIGQKCKIGSTIGGKAVAENFSPGINWNYLSGIIVKKIYAGPVTSYVCYGGGESFNVYFRWGGSKTSSYSANNCRA